MHDGGLLGHKNTEPCRPQQHGWTRGCVRAGQMPWDGASAWGLRSALGVVTRRISTDGQTVTRTLLNIVLFLARSLRGLVSSLYLKVRLPRSPLFD